MSACDGGRRLTKAHHSSDQATYSSLASVSVVNNGSVRDFTKLGPTVGREGSPSSAKLLTTDRVATVRLGVF